MLSKKICSKNIFGQKRFWFQKNFWFKKFFDAKNFAAKNFWFKNFLVQKIFGQKIILIHKEILGQNNVGPKTNFGPTKMFG